MKITPLVLLASAVAALPLTFDSSKHVLHERRLAANGLQRTRRVDRYSVVPFRIALKQTNLEHGYDHLMNVSDPRSTGYGKHWSPDQIRDAFRPSEESIAIVTEWLRSAGIHHSTERKGWLEFEASVQEAEDMLKSTYYEHADDRTGGIKIGCQEYSLPRDISEHVDYIVPGVALSSPMQKKSVARRSYLKPRPQQLRQLQTRPRRAKRNSSNKSAQTSLKHCGRNMTPDCVRALYNIPDPQTIAETYQHSPENTLGLFEYTSVYNQTDVNLFLKKYAPNVPSGTHPYLNATAPASKALHLDSPYLSGEANVDLDEIYSLIYPQTVTLYQILSPRNYKNGVAIALADAVDHFLENIDGSYCDETNSTSKHCGEFKPARVTSISYGTGEIFIPMAQQHRQCNEIMKLALQGHTVVVASGDYGVASQPFNGGTEGCIVAGNFNASTGPDGNGATRNGTVFSPGYPQNCPYVLSVGGTQLDHDAGASDSERALNLHGGIGKFFTPNTFSSSGGFSNYFSRPTYQDDAVSSYFSHSDPGYPYYTFNGIDGSKAGNNIGANGGRYNRAGRGFPDVSANAILQFFLDGYESKEAGTSLSTPIWGSILTLINEKRSEAGKSPVGFVNSVLYQHPEVFNDITRGDNPGCGTRGFRACEGWDPITGLGTPDYPKLLELFMGLP